MQLLMSFLTPWIMEQEQAKRRRKMPMTVRPNSISKTFWVPAASNPMTATIPRMLRMISIPPIMKHFILRILLMELRSLWTFLFLSTRWRTSHKKEMRTPETPPVEPITPWSPLEANRRGIEQNMMYEEKRRPRMEMITPVHARKETNLRPYLVNLMEL